MRARAAVAVATRLQAAAWRAAARIVGRCGWRGERAERLLFPPRGRSGWAAPRLLVAVTAAVAEAVAAVAEAVAAKVAVAGPVAEAEAAMAAVEAVAGPGGGGAVSVAGTDAAAAAAAVVTGSIAAAGGRVATTWPALLFCLRS